MQHRVQMASEFALWRGARSRVARKISQVDYRLAAGQIWGKQPCSGNVSTGKDSDLALGGVGGNRVGDGVAGSARGTDLTRYLRVFGRQYHYQFQLHVGQL